MEQYFPVGWTKRSQVSRNTKETNDGGPLPLLLALELFHDSEVKTSGVLGEDGDMTLFSIASSSKRRN